MNNELIKKYLPYLIAIIVFILFAFVYCSPVLDGKIVKAGDTLSWKGMSKEARDYNNKEGNNTFWTGSMFSGMPTYQITGGKITSNNFLTPINNILSLGFKNVIRLLILYLLGFFILLRSFKIDVWLSIVGAIAITLSSYFFIIIEAGHHNKAIAIAMMAPLIAGFFLIFNKKYILGSVLTMVYCMAAVIPHPQMAYYFFLLIGCFFIAELYIHLKEKKIIIFFVATTIFVASVAVGLGSKLTLMQLNREYVKETMRGGHSELVKEENVKNKTAGLDLDYATQWSYGISETMTLLIPNFMGASSHYDVGTKSIVYKELINNGVRKKHAEEFCKNVPTYWGKQPFTSGPVYVGAIVCFLFVLGLFIVKGPYKWAILVATLFSILLSWGNNFMPLTELFFNYFPMYNKFRAVSSILVVAEVTIPLLGFLAIKAIMDKQIAKEKLLKYLYFSAGITAGICLFFALFGGWFFNFSSPSDESNLAQLPEWLTKTIVAERAYMLRFDALRSFIFIVLSTTVLWLFVKEKIKFIPFVIALGCLILVDMWPVCKRFFNDDNFVSTKFETAHFKKQPYEEYVLQDKAPHFRVFNLTTNSFNESRTSFHLKHIGGYHAAKLRRYQDLISEHISKMNMSVINMLNTKYFIVNDANNNPVPHYNPDAMGNAWFIDSVLVVSTPNEECDALNTIDLKTTAVLDAKFEEFVKDFAPGRDSAAFISLLSYAPNKIEYQSSSTTDGIIVFSEIYYPYGWHAYIDEKPVEHFRTNYTLRALNVPAGEHHIRFEFAPDTIRKYEPLSLICIFIIYSTIIGGIGCSIAKCRKKKI